MLSINFSPFPYLKTERLQLRPLAIEDAPVIFFLRSDSRCMKYIDRDPMQYEEEALALIQKITTAYENNEGITWAISFTNEKQLIGTLGFWRIDKENYRAEVGYMLHPDQQGKGLMQEAITCILDYGFNKMKLHSVEANVNPENEASIKLLERNHFIREAYYRENYHHNGKFLDSAIYSLLTPFR